MECYGKKNALELFQLHDFINLTFYILEKSEDIPEGYSDKGKTSRSARVCYLALVTQGQPQKNGAIPYPLSPIPYPQV